MRTEFELCQLKNELIERARKGESPETLAIKYIVFRDGDDVIDPHEVQLWSDAFKDAASH